MSPGTLILKTTGEAQMAVSPKKREIEPWWQPLDLSRVHTKVLLGLLEASRHGFSRCHFTENEQLTRILSGRPQDDDSLRLFILCVRSELSRREHVLSMNERRQARQEAVKDRNRGRKTSG
jgi:hypothetical protein